MSFKDISVITEKTTEEAMTSSDHTVMWSILLLSCTKQEMI